MLGIAACALSAGALVPVRTIPSRSILTEADFRISDQPVPGAVTSLSDVVGQEARVTLYPGRPLRPGDFGPAALIERNQIVVLRFTRAPLSIETEGRALDRASIGSRVRVMNLASRTVVIGQVLETGIVEVGR